ncbi:MAG: DUF3316 domain-containing protein [Candidatus Amulumruptor caecigallinarius]|nr:DUF3316 domain-containing protein [Candidatus Amulumruptor caecigallinarius]
MTSSDFPLHAVVVAALLLLLTPRGAFAAPDSTNGSMTKCRDASPGNCRDASLTGCPDASGSCDSLPRPVISAYNVETGRAKLLSTYLSPLYYEGLDLALSGSWTKAFNHLPDKLLMRFEASINFQNSFNPARTARMIGLTARFGWGIAWRMKFGNGWQVSTGGMVDIYGGALYQPRNGNNPVTALAYAGIDATASVSYRFHIGRLPVVACDEVRLPSLGAFFSPEYGEPYYEIYLGNKKGLSHLGWWGNAFAIDNLLSLKMDFGRTAMQVGYRFDVRSFWANSLNTQVIRHAFVIGVIPNGMYIKKKQPVNLPF